MLTDKTPRTIFIVLLFVLAIMAIRRPVESTDARADHPTYLPLLAQDKYSGISLTRTLDLGQPIRGMLRNSAEPLFIVASGIILDENAEVHSDFSDLHPEKVDINHGIYHQSFFLLYYDVLRADGHHLYIDRFTHTNGVINMASRREVFSYQLGPNTTHSGGALAIDDRNHLYVSLGDGATQGDPNKYARDLRLLNGSVIRIDPFTLNGTPPDCATGTYGVPAENQLNKPVGECTETLFSGLRHPWRFIVSGTELLIGDVGYSTYEEVNIAERDGYVDFGWSCFEGPEERYLCDTVDITEPTHSYLHFPDGIPLCAIVGVEKIGANIVFADYCANALYAIKGSELIELYEFGSGNLLPTSFERVGNQLFVTTFDGIVIEMGY